MAVKATCAKCNAFLVDNTITKDDGSKVQVFECPYCEGKIKINKLLW